MSNMTLVFNYQGKPLLIQCQENETLDQVFNRYCIKAGLNRNDIKFYTNSKEIKGDNSSLKSNGIYNRHNFDVVASKYVIGA